MTAPAELSPTLQLACDLIRRPSVTPSTPIARRR